MVKDSKATSMRKPKVNKTDIKTSLPNTCCPGIALMFERCVWTGLWITIDYVFERNVVVRGPSAEDTGVRHLLFGILTVFCENTVLNYN